MKENFALNQFDSFLPKEATVLKTDGIIYAVIYTRVSSSEQFKTNGSIEAQLKLCIKMAEQLNVKVLSQFGGTFESAKTEERKEFQRMMAFIKKSKEKIKYIIVSDNDRFSRSGANAIFLAEQLQTKGIQIMAASSPVDTSTSIGAFQQNMQLLFSHYDNQQRREKTIRGMNQKFEKGFFFGALPRGYKRIAKEGKFEIVKTKEAEAIVKAFKLKAEQRLRTSEISKRLSRIGFEINEKRLSIIYRNLFYCGLLSNKMLGRKIVEGINWEPLVSKELFLKANDVLNQFHQPYNHHKVDENIPLRNFITCAKCGTKWTGYIVKKKEKYYYKCNKKGCRCNISAEKMHEEFIQHLKSFEIKPKIVEPLKRQLQLTYEFMNQSIYEQKNGIENRKKELNEKLESAEEKYIEGEIDKEIYLKYKTKYDNLLAEITQEQEQLQEPLSNSEKFIDFSVKLCEDLSKIWSSGDLTNKIKFQKIIFPEGIKYDLQNHTYRTTRINSIILQIAELSMVSAQNKNRNSKKKFQNSEVVERTGIEPVIPP